MTLVLFDIDGTLLLSQGMGRVIIQDALSAVIGRTVSTNGVPFSGRTDPAIALEMLIRAGLSPDEAADLLPACLDAYAETLKARLTQDRVDALPGVLPLVKRLHRDPQVQLGLLTGNLHETAFVKLRAVALQDFFPFGAYGSDNPDRFALPAIALARAARYAGHAFAPDKTVIIGDTEHDVTCGQRAGMRTVAVCTGRYDRPALEVHEPDLILESLQDPEPLLSFIRDV